MLRWYIILPILFLFPVFSEAQNLQQVSAGLSSDSAMIGDQFVLTIQCNGPDSIHFQPDIEGNSLGDKIEILGMLTDTASEASTQTINYHYILTCFDAGYYRIDPVRVLAGSSSFKDTLQTNPLDLTVFAPQVDTTAAFKDIKPLVNTPLNFAEVKPYLIKATLAYILAALVVAILWIVFNRKKIMNILRPALPPHIIALQALDRLREDKLWLKGEVKDYYTRLTDIMRVYLEERFEIRAMESTSAEIMDQYTRLAYHEQEEETAILKDMLELSDLVKFAKADPTASENEMSLSNAIMFVQLTKPPETQTPLTDTEVNAENIENTINTEDLKETPGNLTPELKDKRNKL